MSHIPAWKTFRRTQDLTVLIAGLIYAGAVVHAFSRLQDDHGRLSQHILLWPAGFLMASLLIPLIVGVFCGYAAGIGILAAQAALVRVLERHPGVKAQIEVRD